MNFYLYTVNFLYFTIFHFFGKNQTNIRTYLGFFLQFRIYFVKFKAVTNT